MSRRKLLIFGGLLSAIAIVAVYSTELARAPQYSPSTYFGSADLEKQVLSVESKEPEKPAPAYKRRVSKLLWRYDFRHVPEGRPASKYWNVATPALELYNNEEQTYTAHSENVRVDNDALVLEARKHGNDITSGRVDTEGNFTVSQGTRLEARLKLPKGRGTWPAFWLLSANQPHTDKLHPTEADWQQEKFYRWDGEIDIMEAYGMHPGIAEATAYTYDNVKEGQTEVKDWYKAYHTYWFEWRSNKLTFGVDGKAYHTYTKSSSTVGAWPFTPDNKFYVILNLAMGGDGGGRIIEKTDDVWRMNVQWLKYYKLK